MKANNFQLEPNLNSVCWPWVLTFERRKYINYFNILLGKGHLICKLKSLWILDKETLI